MKKLVRVFILIIICFGLVMGSLWVLQKTHRKTEVIKIYKTTPYEPKSVTAEDLEQASTSVYVSPDAKTKHPNRLVTDDVEITPLTEDELSFLEDLMFLEWTSTLETEDEIEENKKLQLTYGEIENLVLEEYQLLDILFAYGVTFDPYNWEGTCPICGTPDQFQVMHNGNTGRPDYWSCLAPYCGDNGVAYYPYDIIDFVAQMEGMKRYEAARHLAAELTRLLE